MTGARTPKIMKTKRLTIIVDIKNHERIVEEYHRYCSIGGKITQMEFYALLLQAGLEARQNLKDEMTSKVVNRNYIPL